MSNRNRKHKKKHSSIRGGKPRKNDSETINTGQNTDHEHGKIEAAAMTSSDAKSPTLQKNKTDDDRDKPTRWLWRFLEGCGIVAGIVYAVVTVIQWRDLRRNFSLDQRPWIGMQKNMIMQLGYQKDYVIEVQIRNSGKTPAFRGWYWNKSRIGHASDMKPNVMDDGTKHVRMGSIPPGGEAFAILFWRWPEWGDRAFADVIAGRGFIANWGEFVYYDGDGKEHKTQFCVYMKDAGLPTQRLTFCDTFNEMN